MPGIMKKEEALKALGIESFRQMSSDKVMQFASMYRELDPEIVKEAINQFPNFAQLMGEALDGFKDVVIKAMEIDKDGAELAMNARLGIIDDLRGMLNHDELTFEEKKQIIEMMDEQASFIDAKDADARKFRKDGVFAFAAATLGVGGLMLSALGGEAEFMLPGVKH